MLLRVQTNTPFILYLHFYLLPSNVILFCLTVKALLSPLSSKPASSKPLIPKEEKEEERKKGRKEERKKGRKEERKKGRKHYLELQNMCTKSVS